MDAVVPAEHIKPVCDTSARFEVLPGETIASVHYDVLHHLFIYFVCISLLLSRITWKLSYHLERCRLDRVAWKVCQEFYYRNSTTIYTHFYKRSCFLLLLSSLYPFTQAVCLFQPSSKTLMLNRKGSDVQDIAMTRYIVCACSKSNRVGKNNNVLRYNAEYVVN